LGFKIIPEHVIKESAFLVQEFEGANNSFTRLLKAAEEFKQADMTPVFLFDTIRMDVKVVAKETYNKKLN
jgi:hypothetical protein